jgi:hypothetical protein
MHEGALKSSYYPPAPAERSYKILIWPRLGRILNGCAVASRLNVGKTWVGPCEQRPRMRARKTNLLMALAHFSGWFYPPEAMVSLRRPCRVRPNVISTA